MIDFAKLYCDLHPNEIITNFCLKGKTQLIFKNPACWHSAPPVSAHIHNIMSIIKPLPSIKISEPLSVPSMS